MTEILASPKLTDDKANVARLEARNAAIDATYWELTQRLNPQSYAVTIRRVENTKDSSKNPGVISTGIVSEKDEAARKAEGRRRSLANEPPADDASIDEQVVRLKRERAANVSAIEFLLRQIYDEKNRLSIAYCKTKKQLSDDILKRLGKSMLEVHKILCEAHELKRHLIDEGCGTRGLLSPLPEFLPHDKFSQFADWLRDMKREGFISTVPTEIRL
jgi:hypothetical protein